MQNSGLSTGRFVGIPSRLNSQNSVTLAKLESPKNLIFAIEIFDVTTSNDFKQFQTTSNKTSMFRTHTNGELSLKNLDEKVTLSGWVQTIRDKGFMIWIDLRDRYGITQLVFDADRTSAEILEKAKKL